MAKLNKKQREWLNNFQQKYKNAKLVSTFNDLESVRLTLEWVDIFSPITTTDCQDPGMGHKFYHTLKVKLNKSGKLSAPPQYEWRVEYPQSFIKNYYPIPIEGLQLSLPFSILLNLREPSCPVNYVPVRRPKKAQNKVLKPKPIQLSFPLLGVAARLQQMSFLEGNLYIASEQELLGGSVQHYDLETDKVAHLPPAIIRALEDKKASLQEWDSALALFHVGGLQAALTYIDGLDFLRQHLGRTAGVDTKQQVANHNSVASSTRVSLREQ